MKEYVELPQYNLKISRCGEVMGSTRGKILKQSRDRFGYARVYSTLKNGVRKGLFVHRLLAMAFIPQSA